MEYVQVNTWNNWGTTVYYTGNDRDAGRIDSFPIGEKLNVMFPDNHTESIELTERRRGVTISDHGHDYHGTDITYGFNCSYHGIDCWIPLEQVRVLLP